MTEHAPHHPATEPQQLRPTLAQRLSEQPPVQRGHLTESELCLYATRHRLPFGSASWDHLAALQGGERVIYTNGTVRQLSLEALHSTILQYHRANRRIPGMGITTHYTLNTLSAAQELATGAFDYDTRGAACDELDGQTVVTATALASVSEQYQVDYKTHHLEDAVSRAGYRELEDRYPHTLPVLPLGRYRGDAMIFVRDKRKKGGAVVQLTLPEMTAAMENVPLQHLQQHPVGHFLLQRYALMGSKEGFRPRPTVPQPPEHDLVDARFAHRTIDGETVNRLLERASILPVMANRTWSRYNYTIRQILARQSAGVAVPIDALFYHDAADPDQAYIERKRLAQTMAALAECDDDGSSTLLIGATEAAALWEMHIEAGVEEPLAVAHVETREWFESKAAVLNADHVEAFATAMGYAFDKASFVKTLDRTARRILSIQDSSYHGGHLGEGLYMDRFAQFIYKPAGITGATYYGAKIDTITLHGARRMLSHFFEFAASSHEIHVLGHYLKAVRQQERRNTL